MTDEVIVDRTTKMACDLLVLDQERLNAFYGPSPFFARLTLRRPHNIFPMMEVVPYGKTLDRLPRLPGLVRSYVWKLRHRLADRLERIADAIGG